MKILIKGKEYKWTMPKLTDRPRSSGHLLARSILKELYPFDHCFEEVFLPKVRLYLDFFLPSINLVAEINGSQHEKFTIHFHQNKLNFLKAQKRDRLKREILEENSIDLIILKDNEKDLWKQQLLSRI